MLYMFLALAAPAARSSGGMAGMMTAAQPLRYPALAFAFALVLAGYTVWDLDRLSARRSSGGSAGCRAAMGVTMAFMLLMTI
jgi:predicted membrane protein